MTPDERLALISIKIERAKEHVRNLEAEIRSFFMTNPYVVGTKRDPQTRKLIYYLVSVREIPVRLSVITGDALHNIRSALDYLAYQLILIGGGTPDRQSGFPITNTDDAAQYEANRTRKVKGMRPDAIKAIDAIKPYKSGNDTLWRLNELNNIDKHRLVVTIGSHYRSVNLAPYVQRMFQQQVWPEGARGNVFKDMTVPDIFMRPADCLFPLQAGDELFADLPDTEVNEKMQFTFEIAFGEPQVLEGEPLIETLHHMTQAVDDIILSFKPLLV